MSRRYYNGTNAKRGFHNFLQMLKLLFLKYSSICCTVRKEDSPQTIVKSSYSEPYASGKLYLPQADTLYDIKIALAYQSSTKMILCVSNQDFAIFRKDHYFKSLIWTSKNPCFLELENIKFLLLFDMNRCWIC